MVKEKTKKRRAFIKILSCVFIISALVSIFIISSSAEESTALTDYTLDGWWFFDSAPSAPPSSLEGTVTDLSFYSPLYDYEITGVTFNINGVNWALCYGSDYMIYSYNPSQSIIGWASGNSRAMYFDNATISNTVFYDWLVDNAKPYVNVSGLYAFNDSLSLPASPVGNGIFPCEFYFSDLGYDIHYIAFTIEGGEWIMEFDNECVYANLPSQSIVGWDTDFSSRIMDFGDGVLIPSQLYDYLSSNGTFYGEDLVLLNGTYEFPDVLPENGAFMSNITFDYGGTTYVSFGFERGTLYFRVNSQVFVTVYDVSDGGWKDKQSITFDNVFVASDFADNFNYLINYEVPEPEPDPDFPIVPEPDPDPDQSGDYNAGYNAGYNTGYYEGYNTGYNTGYEKGLDEGYLSGYNKGYAEGYTDHANNVDTESFGQNLLSEIFSAPIKALDGIVLSEHTALDGTVVTITLWSIFSTLIIISLCIWIIKIFF